MIASLGFCLSCAGKVISTRGFCFSSSGIAISSWHFAFPAQQKRFPREHFAFPHREMPIPRWETKTSMLRADNRSARLNQMVGGSKNSQEPRLKSTKTRVANHAFASGSRIQQPASLNKSVTSTARAFTAKWRSKDKGGVVSHTMNTESRRERCTHSIGLNSGLHASVSAITCF